MVTDDFNQQRQTHSTEGQNMPPAPNSDTGIISDGATGILTGNLASETAETMPSTSSSDALSRENAERETPQAGALNVDAGQELLPPRSGKKRKKRGFFKKAGIFLLIIILIILIPLAGLIGYALINRTNPARHIADGYYAAVTIRSASDTLQKGLYLSAVDSILSSPETAALQGNLRALRSNTTLQSDWFKRLLNVPINIAIYEDNNAALVADIGIRSAAVTLLPLITAVKPELLDSVPNLSQTEFNISGTVKKGFLFELTKDQRLYICFYKNLIIAATSTDLLYSCLAENSEASGKRLTALLRASNRGAVSVYAEPSYFLSGIAAKQDIVGNMVRELAFPNPAELSVNFDEKTVSFHSIIDWISERAEVNTILQRRSTLPAILSRLPEGTAYLTLLNLGDPQFLYENTKTFFPPELTKTFNSTNKKSKFFFNKDLNQLVFEWMGSEIGVFAHRDSQTPVFFISLKDEAKCRYLLEDLFGTIFIDRSISAVVDDNRIPRIVFPSWLLGLLRAFRIDLPQPFYMIQDGYLYLSNSVEALGMCKKETDTGKLLIKTDEWKKIAKSVSSETSFLVYYSLDRSIPFFLEQNALLKTAFKNYGKGVLSLRFAADRKVYLDFYTQKTDARKVEEIPAFPRSLSQRPETDIICAKTADNVPYIFWTNGSNVKSMNLLTGTESTLPLDGKAGIAAEIKHSKLQALWAVSARGSLYRVNENLEPFAGYPVLTAEKLLPKPVVFNGGIAVPLASDSALLFAGTTDDWFTSEPMNAKLRAAPVIFKDAVAALPRSFESGLFLFNKEGKIVEGYPIELDGIFAAAPVFFEETKGQYAAAFVSEAGRFSIRSLSQDYAETASCDLNTVCKAGIAYSASLRAFFVVSQDGHLFKFNTAGAITDSLPLKTGAADDYRITLLDVTGDGKDELFISGGGNALYGYTAGFAPLDGFPLAGTGTPYLLDIDGDSIPELITHGIDSKVHAYKGVGNP